MTISTRLFGNVKIHTLTAREDATVQDTIHQYRREIGTTDVVIVDDVVAIRVDIGHPFTAAITRRTSGLPIMHESWNWRTAQNGRYRDSFAVARLYRDQVDGAVPAPQPVDEARPTRPRVDQPPAAVSDTTTTPTGTRRPVAPVVFRNAGDA